MSTLASKVLFWILLLFLAGAYADNPSVGHPLPKCAYSCANDMITQSAVLVCSNRENGFPDLESCARSASSACQSYEVYHTTQWAEDICNLKGKGPDSPITDIVSELFPISVATTSTSSLVGSSTSLSSDTLSTITVVVTPKSTVTLIRSEFLTPKQTDNTQSLSTRLISTLSINTLLDAQSSTQQNGLNPTTPSTLDTTQPLPATYNPAATTSSPTSAPSAAVVASVNHDDHHLGTNMKVVIGISTGAALTILFGAGLASFCCFRRRRHNQHQGSNTIDGAYGDVLPVADLSSDFSGTTFGNGQGFSEQKEQPAGMVELPSPMPETTTVEKSDAATEQSNVTPESGAVSTAQKNITTELDGAEMKERKHEAALRAFASELAA